VRFSDSCAASICCFARSTAASAFLIAAARFFSAASRFFSSAALRASACSAGARALSDRRAAGEEPRVVRRLFGFFAVALRSTALARRRSAPRIRPPQFPV
jgi:hypothetical protein